MIRLQKFLSQAGVASRRKSEEYIAQGRIRVNGSVVSEPGRKIDEHRDLVLFDGMEIHIQAELEYYMLHKPEGTVTTVKDQFGRDTVMDLLQNVETRLFPVGRLDYDTSGLLILTNDGDLAYRLTHPKHNIDKQYIAKLRGRPDTGQLSMFRGGIVIDGRKTAPAEIEIIKNRKDYTSVRITIREGRNRQVRKMCDAMGCPAASLKRIAVGKLYLCDLPRGDYRKLTDKEIKYLKSL